MSGSGDVAAPLPATNSLDGFWRVAPALYIGAPILLSSWYALSQAGVLARHFPFPLALACWASILVPRWWCQGAATWVLHRLLARWQPSLTMLAIAGGCLGVLISQPYAIWAAGWFQTTFVQYLPDADPAAIPTALSRAELAMRFVETLPLQILAVAPWVIANVACDRWLGIPRYRYPPATAPRVGAEPFAGRSDVGRAEDSTPPVVGSAPAMDRIAAPQPPDADAASMPAADAAIAEPAFASKLRRVASTDIIAIEAADHFIRVHGSATSEMIYCQFGEALEQLTGCDGLRVHRSWWVRRDAIQGRGRSNGNPSLRLQNGVTIPVGRSYQAAVRGAIAARKCSPAL